MSKAVCEVSLVLQFMLHVRSSFVGCARAVRSAGLFSTFKHCSNTESFDIAYTYLWLLSWSVSLLGPTVFCNKFCEISRIFLQNSAAHCGKIVQIPQLIMAIHLWINWVLSCQKNF